MQPSKEPIQPMLLTIPEVVKCLHISRAKIYRLIQQGSLRVVREGKSVRVSVDTVRAWIQAHEQ